MFNGVLGRLTDGDHDPLEFDIPMHPWIKSSNTLGVNESPRSPDVRIVSRRSTE